MAPSRSSPLGIDCGSACQHTYDRGTTITLTATPATGSRFAGWTGGGCSGTSTCTVTLNADSNATATFTVQSPALSALTVSPRKFALIGRQVKARCQATIKANRNRRHCTRPIALQISYKLNVAARVTFTIKRATAGRVVNGRCLKTTQTNRKRNPCILLTAIPGSLAASAAAGTNRFTFTGRIGGHKLTRGDYRLTATPVAYGHTGAPRTTPFSLTS